MPPDVHENEIYVHIDEHLERKGMTLAALAEAIGISIVNLRRLKNGYGLAIRFGTLAALCRVFECQPGDLLTYKPALKEGGPEWDALTHTE